MKPVYVSIGHMISLAAAEQWVLRCAPSYRVPEPTRLADRLAGEAKRRMLNLTLDIVIEQRAGEEGRWEWVAADAEVVFRHGLDPMPVHYGCSANVVNPADGELLDVMLVSGTRPARGEHLAARVIDVLERADGDHKLLAVPLDARPSLRGVRDRIWRWYVAHEKPVTRWGGEDAALNVVRACRAAT